MGNCIGRLHMPTPATLSGAKPAHPTETDSGADGLPPLQASDASPIRPRPSGARRKFLAGVHESPRPDRPAAPSFSLPPSSHLGDQMAKTGTGPVSGDTAYTNRSGRQLVSVNFLAKDEQETFLNTHDPVRRLELSNESEFYRSTQIEWVKESRIEGNPKSCARILNYQAVEKNPFRTRLEDGLVSSGLTGQDLKDMHKYIDLKPRYTPVAMHADELPHASLNVMFGEGAMQAARGYGGTNSVLVEMTLGDLRKAGGGVVFDDVSAVAGNGSLNPLIVTLPEGRSVPVKIIPQASVGMVPLADASPPPRMRMSASTLAALKDNR